MSFAVAGNSAGIDREHGHPGSLQGDHEQILISLDGDRIKRELVIIVDVLSQQGHQGGETSRTGVDPGPGQDAAGGVEYRHVVVGSARGAVPAFPLVRFLWPPSRTGRASWPRIRLSTSLVRRCLPQRASAMATEWSNLEAGIGW